MRDHFVEFLKGAFIQQEFNALTRGHLAFFVLALLAFLAASGFSQRITALKFRKLLFQVHLRKDYSCIHCGCAVLVGAAFSSQFTPAV